MRRRHTIKEPTILELNLELPHKPEYRASPYFAMRNQQKRFFNEAPYAI
jgi:hypothetical protein